MRIPQSDNYKKEDFYKVNLQGTKNLCAAFEKKGIPKSIKTKKQSRQDYEYRSKYK